MKRKVLKLLSLLLVVVLLASLAACKPKKEKDPTKKPNNSASADIDDAVDGDIEEEVDEDIGREIIVSLASTDGRISSGVKLDYEGEEDFDFGEEFDNIILDDLDMENEITYTPLIQKYGSAVSGSENIREISVDNTKKGVVYTDFQGIGCNVYPTQSILDSQIKEGSRKAYLELQAERFNDIQGAYARSWFQIGWLMTNYAGDDYKKYEKNWENNPDYQAYYNGEYDFENEIFQSCVDYWSVLKEAGTKVEVSFGWKIDTRIQAWFGQDPSRRRIAAPRDLKQYADAAKEMFIYLFDKGLTNVDVLGFYNEPARVEDGTWRDTWDFATLGDKRVYWATMAIEAKKALKSDPRTKHVEIWGAEGSENIGTTSDKYVAEYIQLHYPDLLDAVAMHGYYAVYKKEIRSEGYYDNFFDAAVVARNYYKDKKLMITEFYAADRQFPSDYVGSYADYVWYTSGGWNSSYASYFIAAANTGWNGMLNWGFVGGWVPDPVNMDPANDLNSSWKHPTEYESTAEVHYQFYEQALLNNYVPKKANVNKVTWEGEDIRTAAFTSKDCKDFSLLVEKNEGTSALSFKTNLKQSLGGKTIYVYRFTFESSEANTDVGIHTTVPTLYDTISNVSKTFTYKEKRAEKGLYAFYMFSTIEPLKQIELYKEGTGYKEQAVCSEVSISSGGTIAIEPKFIDCADNGVEWEIKRYSCVPEKIGTKQEQLSVDRVLSGGDLGTLTQNGNIANYTIPSDAQAGDVIALRCTIKGTNGKRFAVAMIHVTN